MGKKSRRGLKVRTPPAANLQSTNIGAKTYCESKVFHFLLSVLLDAIVGLIVGALVSVVLFVVKQKADAWWVAYTLANFLLFAASFLVGFPLARRRPTSSSPTCVFFSKLLSWTFVCWCVYFAVALLLHWAGVWTLPLGMIAWMAARIVVYSFVVFYLDSDGELGACMASYYLLFDDQTQTVYLHYL